ncbi:MAG: hypothetical protein KKE23_01935 [Nanoarchaeota archaeon]|nr:hypothetical protein [Nanoarchaeota archaeon]
MDLEKIFDSMGNKVRDVRDDFRFNLRADDTGYTADFLVMINLHIIK